MSSCPGGPIRIADVARRYPVDLTGVAHDPDLVARFDLIARLAGEDHVQVHIGNVVIDTVDLVLDLDVVTRLIYVVVAAPLEDLRDLPVCNRVDRRAGLLILQRQDIDAAMEAVTRFTPSERTADPQGLNRRHHGARRQVAEVGRSDICTRSIRCR
ncbi:hypothetical protein D3C76_1320830 [compost metagenome]